MFEQLYGVLREVVCLDTDEPKPAISGAVSRRRPGGAQRTGDLAADRGVPAAAAPDPDDSAAGAIMSSAGLKPDKLAPYLAALRQQFPRSKELTYAEIDLAISQGEYAERRAAGPRRCAQANPYDWKAWFLQGRIAFLRRRLQARRRTVRRHPRRAARGAGGANGARSRAGELRRTGDGRTDL